MGIRADSLITLRVFDPVDLPEVLSLLRAELPAHQISEPLFVRKVLLDVNFDSDCAVVARDAGGNLAGFVLSITRKVAFEGSPDDSNHGWITLFAVRSDLRRQSIGTQMFDAVETVLGSKLVTEIRISSYTPHYWTPGVDEAAHPDALRFLKNRGYEVVSRPLAMATDLSELWFVPAWASQRERELSQSARLRIEPISASRVLPLVQFLAAEFPGDWQRHIRETVNEIYSNYRSAEDVQVATSGGEICGFSHTEGDRFGPFGVAASRRGSGIGAVLLYRSLNSMRQRGSKRAWFMWTGDGPAQRVYAPAGFVETNRYSIVAKKLQ